MMFCYNYTSKNRFEVDEVFPNSHCKLNKKVVPDPTKISQITSAFSVVRANIRHTSKQYRISSRMFEEIQKSFICQMSYLQKYKMQILNVTVWLPYHLR